LLCQRAQAKLEAQAQQDMASATQGRGAPLGQINVSAGESGKAEGNDKNITKQTSTREKVEKEEEGEEVVKSKEEEILELYLKQHQQDKQSKQPGDHEELTNGYLSPAYMQMCVACCGLRVAGCVLRVACCVLRVACCAVGNC
jgi:Flp pilus assembly protein TadB